MSCSRYHRLARLAVSTVLLFGPVVAYAQDVKVMSSGGFSAAYRILEPQYEKQKGVHVDTVWGPSMGSTPGAIPVRLARGEDADVVIMARSELDALAKKGDVIEGSQVDLARSRIGIAIRSGAAAPDISTVAAFRKLLLDAKSVAYSDSASGVYIQNELFKRLGITEQMASKSHQVPAEPVGKVVARGDAEIGFQQMSELKPIQGITLVGPIPEELQKVTVFSAGIVTKGKSKDAGRELIRYLSSPAVCEEIQQTAMEPVACAAAAAKK